MELLPKGVWINIASYNTNGGVRFTNPSWIDKNKLKCAITYPLNKPCVFEVEVPANKFPVEAIIEAIINKYREIYKDGCNGEYKPWGHDIIDLDIVSIELNDDLLTLKVDS